MRILHVIFVFCGLLTAASAATLFEDGFEDGTLGDAWSVSATNDGRASIRSEFDPAGGQRHLVLDDSVNDAASSVAEATLSLDLHKKRNVVLSFKAKSLGNEPHPPPIYEFTDVRDFDGVSISLDAGANWRTVQSLDNVPAQWTAFSIDLDAVVGGASAYGTTHVRIRFSGYDNSPAPIDGIAIDDVLVQGEDDARAIIELPATTFQEGSGPHAAILVVSPAPAADLVFAFDASDSAQLSLPATVTVSAGQTAVGFVFSVVDDALFNRTRTLWLSPSAAGVLATPVSLVIQDNDTPVSVLTVPTHLNEGEATGNNASLTIDRIPTAPVSFQLTATPPGYVSMPAVVTLEPGLTGASFSVRATENTRIDGPVVVTIQATSVDVEPSSASSTVIDNEARILTLELPDTMVEGQVVSGKVKIPGTMRTDLRVELEMTPAGLLTQVQPITLPAGTRERTIQIQAPDNKTASPPRAVEIKAVVPEFFSEPHVLVLYDDDPASYTFSAMRNVAEAGKPWTVKFNAQDPTGYASSHLAGAVNLHLEQADGSLIPLTQEPIELNGPWWTGEVTIPPVAVSPVRFVAIDAQGARGASRFLEVMRRLPLATNDLVWDKFRNRLYASVGWTGDSNAYSVVAIDPMTLEVVPMVQPVPEPMKLALSDGGERLYVALNGGNIVAIDVATFTALYSFPVGTSPAQRALFVEDMVVAPGRPDVLVVVRAQGGDFPGPNSVAAYHQGVALPVTTPEGGPVCDSIEATEEPSVFLGHYRGRFAGNPRALRRLRLSDTGVAWEESFPLAGVNDSFDFEVGGGIAVFDGGYVVDASNGQLITGLRTDTRHRRIESELSLNRVFFLDSDSFESFDRLSVFDLPSRSLLRSTSFDTQFYFPTYNRESLTRWGSHGLAFRTMDSIILMNSAEFVPGLPAADVEVHVDADPPPVSAGKPYRHVIRVLNRGPETARRVILDVTIGGDVSPVMLVASQGVVDNWKNELTAVFGDLAPGVTATLTAEIPSVEERIASCEARVRSSSFDPDHTNNRASRVTMMLSSPAADSAQSVFSGTNPLIYDPRRRLLWTTGSASFDQGGVMSIDPLTGRTSEFIVFAGGALPGTLALSGNGRYLYVGINSSPDVMRLDLDTDPPGRLWIPLRGEASPFSQRAADIEVLDGDGTAILVATAQDKEVLVIDGVQSRPARVLGRNVMRIERTGLPGVFAGISDWLPFELLRLVVNEEGVSIDETLDIDGVRGVDIVGDGPWVLSTEGLLFDIRGPTQKWNLGMKGRPCLDFAANDRAYIVTGRALHGFDAVTGETFGSLSLLDTIFDDWAGSCVRWGLDGFAIQGTYRLVLARWTQAIPEQADDNANGIPDRWEAMHLGPFGGDLRADPDGDGLPSGIEYVFGTAAGRSTADPQRVSRPEPGVVRLVFPRRAGIEAGFYGYEASAPGLDAWIRVTPERENVLSTETVDGVAIETVEAEFRLADSQAGFVRLVWLGR